MAVMQRVEHEARTWTQRLGDRIEGIVELVSPRAALDRRAYKAAAMELAGFKGARKTRVRGDIPSGGRQDFHLQAFRDRWDMVEVARRLERDSVVAESLISRSVENIVGPGFSHQSRTSSPRFNKAADKLWRDWASTPDQCDVRGLSTINELLRLTCRARLRDGDMGTILLSSGQIQIVESDQIVSPSRSSTPTKRMVDGVELDRVGRPIRFHVTDDPDPILGNVRFSNTITAIPRDSFVFTAVRERHGQTRGTPKLAKVAWLIEQIDGNI